MARLLDERLGRGRGDADGAEPADRAAVALATAGLEDPTTSPETAFEGWAMVEAPKAWPDVGRAGGLGGR